MRSLERLVRIQTISGASIVDRVAHVTSDPASSDDEPLGRVSNPAPQRSSPPRRIVIGIAILLVFGAGLGTGLAVPDDTTELEAVQSQVVGARNQVENLQSALANARDDNAALATSLSTAESVAEAAGKAAASRQRKQNAREAGLDERAAALDSREADLDERELAVDEPDDISPAPTGPASSSAFDRGWAVDIASDIVRDVKTVDHRLGDGIAVESAMFLLAGDYPRLLDAGIPPEVDEAKYVARLETLESFTDQAADLYTSNPTEGSARYAVVREQTGVLLDELNAAIGSDFRLP